MSKNTVNKKQGFTLVEVLIALSIIGVIAVLTIPSMMVSVQRAKIKAQSLKFISDMEQAIFQYENNGGDWRSALTNSTTLSKAFASVMKTQGYTPGMLTKTVNIKAQAGVGMIGFGDYPIIPLSNGTDVIIWEFSMFGNLPAGAYSSCNTASNNICANFLVDFDGTSYAGTDYRYRRYNKFASDVFLFSMKKEKNGVYSIIPTGSDPTKSNFVAKNLSNWGWGCDGAGWFCSAEILGGLTKPSS